MHAAFLDQPEPGTLPLTALTRDALAEWRNTQDTGVTAWLDALAWKAEAGATALLPGPEGRPVRALAGLGDRLELWAFGGLPFALPPGSYALDPAPDRALAHQAALGWALGSYRYDRFRTAERAPARLVWPESCDRAAILRAVEATALVRDLVNAPANHMGPAELALAAERLAGDCGAAIEVIAGDDLLARNYPAVHAVGRASARAPRLIDLRWGPDDAPRVTLVGKGVCFDSGGLDLKPSGGMLLMKKDMGGAAHALGVARMVMQAGLRVRLRVLVPAVENMVAGNAFRPLDVIPTRKGLSVEIGNTDAEGRVILADALAEADAEQPALLVDFATLTGAARAALGPDLPALFCNHEPTAAALLGAAQREADPMWRLPLWPPYARLLKSRVADISNTAEGSMAGAITAALFLERFVSKATPWVHLDLYAWNGSDRPGRPKGGEAMGLRAVYGLIEQRFGG